ncbi:nitric oxide dioxygenase [Bordetella genomosp. 9]|uniref:NO-inducible flavohemoprotein n=1 Tax=Bordetella genomosp. 9 TaxID=1416803 RepID=UPI000A2920D9|nr:NO-inducible flavohemoprotein [Bordetella genomosp. 9]ARP92857.1 nitric oxide dioxygenase [Bordetella genomosp. 9]
MLDSKQLAIIRATVPLLETGGEALTTHFYKILLAEHPEVRPLFNQAHQASGEQPRALANGVLAYARNIDRLQALAPLATQIVNKHVSLQVQPEHYPIVGACLLRAIREVLGPDTATDEVIAAWSAAYGQLADMLIQAEAAAYEERAQAPGGWRGARPFVVDRKVAESAAITSFYLRPADGGAVLAYQPGQYLGLRLDVDGQEIRRNYSLSQAPNGSQYRISVKREPGGVASNFLHDRVNEGDTVDVFPPAGEFVLQAGERPLALISGGVGITPVLAMLEAALQAGVRPIHFIHYARSCAVHAFRDHVDQLAARHPQLHHFVCYEDATDALRKPDDVGLAHIDQLRRWLPSPPDVDAYFVGPKGFMRYMKKTLDILGVPAAQSRYEFFGPASAL